MDLIIFLILLVAVIVFYRDIKFVAYFIGILEIAFRLIHYLGDNLPIIHTNFFVDSYIPNSIFTIFDGYVTGIVGTIIDWAIVLLLIIFVVYLIRYFFRMK